MKNSFNGVKITKEITSKNWYEAENYRREDEALRICKTCGHLSEMHEWSDYEGEHCIEENCECDNFVCKIVDNKIVYDGD